MYLMDQLVLIGNTHDPSDSMCAFADYVYHHFDEVADRSIDEVARASALSAPTVSRLIKQLGYPNYRAFRDQVRVLADQYRVAEQQRKPFAFTPDNAAETLARDIAPALSAVTDAQLDLFLRYLLPPAGTAYLVGLANMHALAIEIQFALAGFHRNDAIAPRSFALLENIRPADTLVVFSSSGNIFRSSDLAQRLRACPASRLLVTTPNLDDGGRNLAFHDTIVLAANPRAHLVGNYVIRLFVDMALCRAGLYD